MEIEIDKPNIKTHIFRHECYGGGDIFGHKIWVHIEPRIRFNILTIADANAAKYKNTPVLLDGKKFKANEITVFLYFDRDIPISTADNWQATWIVTFTRRGLRWVASLQKGDNRNGHS